MALKAPLGFGMMRLPTLNNSQTDFNYAELDQMVDTFLKSGYTYFDTSFVYHQGKSEEAVHNAVVKRHPRDSFTLATKFPAFSIKQESEIEPIFEQQLRNLGVDYFDYYLLHNIQTIYYDGVDGKGGTIKTTNLFEHAKQWKKQGLIRKLGFSIHSSAAQLDRVLDEHPEVDFVQISLNYLDWSSQFVQAQKCYEAIRRHEKQVVIMEPVKGGGLSAVPQTVREALAMVFPGETPASIALRFAGSFDGIMCILSGMSTLEQVEQNIRTFKDTEPLTEQQMHELETNIAKLYRDADPVGSDLSKYDGMTLAGVPVGAIMEAYGVCQLQPNPGFADDDTYFKNLAAENAHVDIFKGFPEERFITADGTDITNEVMHAAEWLRDHSLF